jgi:hypothetical protein
VIDLRVDRLVLRVGGLSTEESRRLARLVAEYAAALDGPAASAAQLRLRLPAQPGEPLEATARRIAAELALALTRSP